MPDIVTGKTFVDGEKGITATKLNQIQSLAVIQPAFYSTKPSSPTLDPTDVLLELKGTGTYAQITGSQIASSVAGQLPLADTTQNGMLRKVSGLTTDFIDGTNNCQNLASGPGITAMRLRSFNSIGNPNFEVDQRNAGTLVANPASQTLVQDRWLYEKTGTFVASSGQNSAAANEVLLPGTNFAISRKFHRITLTTSQTTLAATDHLTLYTQLEGPVFRELQYDVHSVSLLVRSSVGLKFGLAIRDPTGTKSLTKLCTLSSANVWTLISLPNLPVFPSAGTFSSAPGVVGYTLNIGLASGSSLTAVANDTWQNGNFMGAAGQDSFVAQGVGATFDIAFVQHEPSAQCSTLMDCPFRQNYDDCLRYFQKSYDYGVVPGSVSLSGMIGLVQGGTTLVIGPTRFHKPMAKDPAVMILYNGATGATNTVRHSNGSDYVVTSVSNPGQTGFLGLNTGTMPAVVAGAFVQLHYIADTGW